MRFIAWVLLLLGGCAGTVTKSGTTQHNGLPTVPAELSAELASAQTKSPPGQRPDRVVLLAAGDIAYCRSIAPQDSTAARTAQLAHELLGNDARARLLTLGDNVYEIGSREEFRDCYHPTWGTLAARTWPLPGNHDYGVPDARGYFDYFGPAAGEMGSGYYARTLNGWTIITLNSNVSAEPGSAQHRWLDEQLRLAPNRCIIAAWHHPRFTSAPRGPNLQTAPLFDLLVQARAALILQAHEHHYERLAQVLGDGTLDAERGIVSMVVGTGGAPSSGYLPTPHPASRFQLRQYGMLKLELSAGHASWTFVDVERRSHDPGELKCKG